MLWIQTYKPKSFSEMTTHLDTVNMLSKYTIEEIPNIIFHGQLGHNKKTLLYALIYHLYGKYPEPVLKTVEMKINSKTTIVNYLETEEIIEISPSDYGTKDRHVIQNLVKNIAESRPILSFFGFKKHSIKVLVIDNAESLSRDAQAALRITMEKYSQHFRLFMICTELSKLIEPIRSRSIFFRIRGFSDEEIFNICKFVLEKEKRDLSNDIINEIVKNADGNCERALCVLDLYCHNENENKNKKQKLDLSSFKLEWEKQVDRIVEIIKNKPRVESFIEIRKELYLLLNNCISADMIIVYMARKLCNNSFEINNEISKSVLVYYDRIRLGSKHLLHLEAFAATAMNIFLKKKNLP